MSLIIYSICSSKGLWRIHIAAVVERLVGVLKFFPKQNPISQVPNPAVLQFLEVATTPSSIWNFDGVEGKRPINPVGKKGKRPPQVQIVGGAIVVSLLVCSGEPCCR